MIKNFNQQEIRGLKINLNLLKEIKRFNKTYGKDMKIDLLEARDFYYINNKLRDKEFNVFKNVALTLLEGSVIQKLTYDDSVLDLLIRKEIFYLDCFEIHADEDFETEAEYINTILDDYGPIYYIKIPKKYKYSYTFMEDFELYGTPMTDVRDKMELILLKDADEDYLYIVGSIYYLHLLSGNLMEMIEELSCLK